MSAQTVTEPQPVVVRPTGRALVLGRALHAPWNEGTRVINRNFVRAVEAHRLLRVVSITQARFRAVTRATCEDAPEIRHVYSRAGYGLAGIYAGLPWILRELSAELTLDPVRVAHLFGVPLSVAPWLRSRHIRVVSHVMGRSVRSRDRALVWLSLHLFDRWVDAYAVTSEALRPSLVRCGIDPRKIVVLQPAIDTEVFCPGDRDTARRRLGLETDDAIVIYMGRLSPLRFPAPVISRALEQAAQRITRRLQFVALAPGHTFDGSENTAARVLGYNRAAERALRQTPGVTTIVKQTDLTDADKVAWLQAADVVLLPFNAAESVEPPLSLLEAMASGACVLATPAANRSGLIEPGLNGLIFEDATQLAAELAAALERPTDNEMRARARQTIIERHSLIAVAAAANELWERVEHRSRRDEDWRV